MAGVCMYVCLWEKEEEAGEEMAGHQVRQLTRWCLFIGPIYWLYWYPLLYVFLWFGSRDENLSYVLEHFQGFVASSNTVPTPFYCPSLYFLCFLPPLFVFSYFFCASFYRCVGSGKTLPSFKICKSLNHQMMQMMPFWWLLPWEYCPLGFQVILGILSF